MFYIKFLKLCHINKKIIILNAAAICLNHKHHYKFNLNIHCSFIKIIFSNIALRHFWVFEFCSYYIYYLFTLLQFNSIKAFKWINYQGFRPFSLNTGGELNKNKTLETRNTNCCMFFKLIKIVLDFLLLLLVHWKTLRLNCN